MRAIARARAHKMTRCMPKHDAYENGHSTLLRIDRIYRHHHGRCRWMQTTKEKQIESFFLLLLFDLIGVFGDLDRNGRLVFMQQNNYNLFISICSDTKIGQQFFFSEPNAPLPRFGVFFLSSTGRQVVRVFKPIRNYSLPFDSRFSFTRKGSATAMQCVYHQSLRLVRNVFFYDFLRFDESLKQSYKKNQPHLLFVY